MNQHQPWFVSASTSICVSLFEFKRFWSIHSSSNQSFFPKLQTFFHFFKASGRISRTEHVIITSSSLSLSSRSGSWLINSSAGPLVSCSGPNRTGARRWAMCVSWMVWSSLGVSVWGQLLKWVLDPIISNYHFKEENSSQSHSVVKYEEFPFSYTSKRYLTVV